ncbi:hypothetical protein [Micromonospora sp. NPDC005172]
MWQPAPGLYARAVLPNGNAAALERAVGALRWNQARRCQAPLRLTSLPEGSRVTGCAVDIASYPRLVTARLALQRADTEIMTVEYRYASSAGTSTTSDRTIAGRPALLTAKGTRLELIGIPRTTVLADFGWPWQGEPPAHIFTEADATSVLAGAQVTADPTRPESWK